MGDNNQSVWRIAAGVTLGILATLLIIVFAQRIMVERAMRDMQLKIEQEQARSRQIQEEQRRQADARERQRRDILAAQERARTAATFAAATEAEKRETAWKKFYRKPSHCESAEGQVFVDCTNHYIRSKREFDKLYAEGRL